jgi:hypothetical protein
MKHIFLALLCIGSLNASQRSASAPVETYEAQPGSFADQLNTLFKQGRIDAAVVAFLMATSEAINRVKQNQHADSAYELVLKAQERLAKETDSKISDEQFLQAAAIAKDLNPECLLTWKLLLAHSAHRSREIGGAAGDSFYAAMGPLIPEDINNLVYQFSVANHPPRRLAYNTRKAQLHSALQAVLTADIDILLPDLHQYIVSYAVAPGALISDFTADELYEKQDNERSMSLKCNHRCISALTGLATIPHIRRTTKLNLAQNSLTSISPEDLKPMRRLEVINLSHNEIEHIADGTFAPCPDLKKLILWNNPIQWRSAMLTGLINLNTLDVRNTGICEPSSDLLSEAPNLMHLDMRDNPVKRLPKRFFEHNQWLQTINLSNCFLIAIAHGIFSDRRQLRTINLTHNPHLLRAPLAEINVPELLIEPEALRQIEQAAQPRRHSVDLANDMIAGEFEVPVGVRQRRHSF